MSILRPEKFECIEQLLDEPHNHNPQTLLKSLCKALGRKFLADHLEYVSGVEDWRFKINKAGYIYDSEKSEESD